MDKLNWIQHETGLPKSAFTVTTYWTKEGRAVYEHRSVEFTDEQCELCGHELAWRMDTEWWTLTRKRRWEHENYGDLYSFCSNENCHTAYHQMPDGGFVMLDLTPAEAQ